MSYEIPISYYMKSKNWKDIPGKINSIDIRKARKSLFYTPESRFSLSIGLKFFLIPAISSIILAGLLYIFMRLNFLFFKSNGFSEIKELEGAYYEYIFNDLLGYFPIFILCICGFFFVGVYLSKILLRPFHTLSRYCTDTVDGYRACYEPDEFSDFRLLTRMSEFFFGQIEGQVKEGKIEAVHIPEHFTRVHGPKFEKAFFLHFSLLVSVIMIVYGYLTIRIGTQVHDSILSMAIESLKTKDGDYLLFFQGQAQLMNYIIMALIGISTILYASLAINLYNKVSGGAFGIFSTLRSFLKGNHKARVHLIGYEHLRSSTRAINRYLDYLEKNYCNESLKKHNDNIRSLKSREQKG